MQSSEPYLCYGPGDDATVVGVAKHGVGLATACLPISKDAHLQWQPQLQWPAYARSRLEAAVHSGAGVLDLKATIHQPDTITCAPPSADRR